MLQERAKRFEVMQKTWQERVLAEREQIRPLPLSSSQQFLMPAHEWICRMAGVWMESMMVREGEISPVGGGGWLLDDDGLFRAPSNVNQQEPWNRKRLHTQLQQYSQTGAIDASALDSLVVDEERELLGCDLAVPSRCITDDGDFTLRLRSHAKSDRAQLKASCMYELRIEVFHVTLLRFPPTSELIELQSPEASLAAQLQERYRTYRQLLDSDLANLLDGKLDALVEKGKSLRAERDKEAKGELAERERGKASKAWLKHLEERRQVRSHRDHDGCRQERLLCITLKVATKHSNHFRTSMQIRF